jgi:hypothetical protein
VAVPQRVVLLGASNLSRSLRRVVRLIRATGAAPLDLQIAAGHGRSYGIPSSLLGRRLPGILQCGIWDALAARPGGGVAVLTDVGNDLLYGAHPATLAGWVRECVERLHLLGFRAGLVDLPLASLGRLSPGRYRALRSILFPSSRLTYDDLQGSLTEVSERLAGIRDTHGLPFCVPDSAWYGWDLIHIRRDRSEAAWREMLGMVIPLPAAPAPRGGGMRRPVAWFHPPEQRSFAGWSFRNPQPCHRFEDGSSLSLY